MKRFDNLEKANAREWDEISTTSYAPSTAELEAPVDDNEQPLVDLSESSGLPQRAPTTQSNAQLNTQRPAVNNHQNITRESTRATNAQPQSTRQTQSNFKPGRALTSSRGRGGNYAQHVTAARHPQNAGGPRRGFNQTSPYQARTQASGVNRSRAPSVPTYTRQASSAGHQRGFDRTRQGFGYRGSDQAYSATRRREHHNANSGKFDAFGNPLSKKDIWGRPEGLITTRRAIDNVIKKEIKEERERFLGNPIEERILAYGFYLWPRDDCKVFDVLGVDLAPLNHIRMSHKVYIQCVQEEGLAELLKISSESPNAEAHITEAIKGIRSVIAHAKARAVLATPKFFVVPPTASAMRTIIGPREVITVPAVVDGVETTRNFKCIGTHLLGEQLSEKEQKMWIKNTLNVNAYSEDFQDRLSKKLVELAPLKCEMRMRLNFGHVIFWKFPSEFSTSQMSFDQFIDMLAHPWARVEIEKTMPAHVVLRMAKRITSDPNLLQTFRPAEGRSLSLKEVDFKHTEIFRVTNRRGDKFRVEANIDMRYDDNWEPEYQLGTYNVYREDQRNKRIELSTIDPEKQVDYTLQIITDTPVEITKATVREFETLVEGSISVKQFRVDSFNLKYPRIQPRSSTELKINNSVMRSVIQYAFQGSGYIVEITLDRTWDGPGTTTEPRMTAHVAIFHPQWEWEMESIEQKTEGRHWKRGLRTFFENGFENFLAAVQTIQGFLSDAAIEAEEDAVRTQLAREAALQAEAEAILEAERASELEAEEEEATTGTASQDEGDVELSDESRAVLEDERRVTSGATSKDGKRAAAGATRQTKAAPTQSLLD